MVRNRIEFAGRVQGVGFRARCCRLAAGLPVTGWVRNEEGGSVTMEVQGDRETVAGYLKAVRDEMGHLVSEERRAAMAVTEGEFVFEIRG